MKTIYICLFMFLSILSKAQFVDDFSDGNFTTNPVWSGDINQYIINAQHQLQLNSTGTDVSTLSTPFVLNTLDSIEWHCFVRLSFSPSSSNYGRIYLASDSPNLEGPLNGYFIQLGETLSGDAVELFEQNQSTLTSVARGTNGSIANSFSIGIRVTRSSNGIWRIYVDNYGGNNYLLQASGTNNIFNSSGYFGVLCKYTTSNASSFYFDDFYSGPIIVDSIPPAITQVNVTSLANVDVKFSEPVENVSAQNNSNYFVNYNIGNPVVATQDIADFSLVHLTFANNLSPGLLYTMSINNITDVNNNIISPESTFKFVLPDTVQPGDIVINEILFNPSSGGYDFVELYNRSSKIIDLSKLKIANADLTSGEINVSNNVSMQKKLFYPDAYLCVTENPDDIKGKYNTKDPATMLTISDLPSYNDDEGICVLVDESMTTVDRFYYSYKYHYPLLNNVEGVSLERINPLRPTQDSSNWHSASVSSGYATPGYKNSQLSLSGSDGSEITIEPDVFSPDNDGFQDILNIHYKFEKPGFSANAKIFDAQGRYINDLVKSELLGTEEGTWSWDGIDYNHQKANIGIYVIYIEVFSVSGEVKKFKKPFVLAAKL